MRMRLLQNGFIRLVERVFEKSKLLTDLYIKFFKRLTLDEFSRVSTPRNILMIGCGPIPHTSIILAKEKGWKITGIDRDSKAVEKAKGLVERYGLKDKVRIMKGDGLNFNLSGYDLIVLAHGVEPKDKVLKRVLREMDNGAVVLFRTTWEVLNIFYGKEDIPEDVSVLDVFYRLDFMKSIFLTVKNN